MFPETYCFLLLIVAKIIAISGLQSGIWLGSYRDDRWEGPSVFGVYFIVEPDGTLFGSGQFDYDYESMGIVAYKDGFVVNDGRYDSSDLTVLFTGTVKPAGYVFTYRGFRNSNDEISGTWTDSNHNSGTFVLKHKANNSG